MAKEEKYCGAIEFTNRWIEFYGEEGRTRYAQDVHNSDDIAVSIWIQEPREKSNLTALLEIIKNEEVSR